MLYQVTVTFVGGLKAVQVYSNVDNALAYAREAIIDGAKATIEKVEV